MRLKEVLKKEITYKSLLIVLLLLSAIFVPSFMALRYRSAYQQALRDVERVKNTSAIRDLNAAYAGNAENSSASAEEIIDVHALLCRGKVIAHAMGGYEGNTYLNCLEGFLEAYKRGCRAFEADFSITRDGYIVLRHDWSLPLQEGIDLFHVPTREQFLSVPILGKYTPLSFRDLLALMAEYEDICVITDTKYAQPELAVMMFQSMLEDAKAMNLSAVFERVIVQVYSEDMLFALKAGFGFSNYIYTLYQQEFDETDSSFREIASLCYENGVRFITMHVDRWRESFSVIAKENDLFCLVHPVTDVSLAKSLISSGVDAVYSFSLSPDEISS